MFSIKDFRTRKEKSIYKLTNITFIVFLTVMLILGCFFLTGKLSRDISAESFYTLRSVSTESSKAIMEMLQSRVDYLNSVWLLMNEGPEDLRRDKIRNQQSRRDLYNFEWIGYTDVSGIGWNSIGLDVDLSDSILFRENKAENICLAEIPIQWPDSDQLMGGGVFCLESPSMKMKMCLPDSFIRYSVQKALHRFWMLVHLTEWPGSA